MGILLAFAPFIVFAVVQRLVGPGAGLVAGTGHLRTAFILFRGLAAFVHEAAPVFRPFGRNHDRLRKFEGME